MPTLEELIRSTMIQPSEQHATVLPQWDTAADSIQKLQDLIFRKKYPGPGRTVKELFLHPWESTKGAADFLNAAIPALGHQAANALQALGRTGEHFPYATDEPIALATSLMDLPREHIDRLDRIVNALSFGIFDTAKANIDKNLPPGSSDIFGPNQGTDAPLDKKLSAIINGLGQTAVLDVFPGRKLGRLAAGMGANEQPIYAREASKELFGAVVQAAPFTKLVGKIKTPAEKMVGEGRVTSSIDTIGKIEARLRQQTDLPNAAARAASERQASAALLPEDVPRITLPPELQFHRSLKEDLLDNSELKGVVGEAMRTKVFFDVAERLSKKGELTNKIVSQTLREGAVDPKRILDIVQRENLSLENASKSVADMIEATATSQGRGQRVFKEAANELMGELFVKAKRGDKEALAHLRGLQRTARRAETYNDLPSVINWWKDIESFRIPALVFNPRTAARNFEQGAAGFVTQLFGDLVQGSARTIIGLNKEGVGALNGKKFSEYYGDLLGDFSALYTFVSPKRRAEINRLLDSIPEIGQGVRNASGYAAGTSALSDLLKGNLPKSRAEVADLTRDTLSVFNRLQEAQMRKVFFEARLRANLPRAGVKDFTQLFEELGKSKSNPLLEEAINDAYNHSLKQTYASRPESNFGRAMLGAYQKFPIPLTAIITPFPRFISNSFRYVMERSPTLWFELFNPKFREILTSGADNGFASLEAARTLGRATEGLLLFSGAYAVRTSPFAGPKYWDLKVGQNPDGSAKYEDLRNYDPFGKYLAAADIFDRVTKGQSLEDLPYSLNEKIDMAAGIRRLTEIPLFSVTDIARGFNNSFDEGWRALSKPAGQYFGGFFRPFSFIQDLYESQNPKEAVQRDTEYSEFTGPARQNIGFALPDKYKLPPRIDYTTGDPIPHESTGTSQLGLTFRSSNPLKDVIANLPGLLESDLVGGYGSQEADALVARSMGTILGLEIQKGMPLRNLIAEIFNSGLSETTPQFKASIMKTVFKLLRGSSVNLAKTLRPDLYMKEDIKKSAPDFAQETVGDIIAKILGELRAAGAIPQPAQAARPTPTAPQE